MKKLLTGVDIFGHGLTTKVWRLRVGETITDIEILCSPNRLQKTQLEQFGTTDLLAAARIDQ